MKFLVLLAIVASCSTKKMESPTETDAQQVSPYTVEDCYCMKIFKPVCANGQNYGNSCEAECHGHKSWTEGQCRQK